MLQNRESPRTIYKETKEPSLAFGGQAVLEGVMIRSRKHMVICVRSPQNKILTKKEEIDSLSESHKVLRLPFVRGILALLENLYLGFKGISWSAGAVLEEEGEEITYKEIAIIIVMVIALATFFMVVPFLLTSLLNLTGVIFNIAEAFVRLSFLLIYLKLVSFWSEFRRILQYHGAEHKVINTFESGSKLNLKNAKESSRLHPRCGTSFVFIILLTGILLFSIMPNTGFFARLAYRVILIPFIGAISYEFLKFSDRHRNSRIMRIIVMPGLGLQHLTTKEPDDGMIEVALSAVNEMTSTRESYKVTKLKE